MLYMWATTLHTSYILILYYMNTLLYDRLQISVLCYNIWTKKKGHGTLEYNNFCMSCYVLCTEESKESSTSNVLNFYYVTR